MACKLKKNLSPEEIDELSCRKMRQDDINPYTLPRPSGEIHESAYSAIAGT
jgi:hypothetical protein